MGRTAYSSDDGKTDGAIGEDRREWPGGCVVACGTLPSTMPVYEYRCRDCGHEFDIQQSMSDDALTECPSCGGALRKVFSPVGIAFKGSGFYKNDAGSRSKSKAEGSKSDSSSSNGESSKGESSKSDSSSGGTKSDNSSGGNKSDRPSKKSSASSSS